MWLQSRATITTPVCLPASVDANVLFVSVCQPPVLYVYHLRLSNGACVLVVLLLLLRLVLLAFTCELTYVWICICMYIYIFETRFRLNRPPIPPSIFNSCLSDPTIECDVILSGLGFGWCRWSLFGRLSRSVRLDVTIANEQSRHTMRTFWLDNDGMVCRFY